MSYDFTKYDKRVTFKAILLMIVIWATFSIGMIIGAIQAIHYSFSEKLLVNIVPMIFGIAIKEGKRTPELVFG